jgi:hypothetical protein
MKTNCFRKNASVKAGAHVRRFLGKLGMTVLLMLCVPAAVLSAQPGVTITGLAVEAGTVTLDVRWEPLAPPVVWSDTVWVFVDYNDAGTMKRLLLTGATLTATSAPDVGKVEQLAGNNKGVRVIGDARTNSSFSATVQLLTATTNVAGACAYASNYPPVAEYVDGKIKFTGTPPYYLVLNTGSGPALDTAYNSYNLLTGQTLDTFTDKTGAPGIIKCVPPTVYTLLASSPLAFCDSDPGATFSLQNTQSGVNYRLYRDDTTPVGNVLTGNGSAQTFTSDEPFKVTGVYTAKSLALSGYCEKAMTGSHNVVAYSAITAGTITSATATTNAGTPPSEMTIYSTEPASGGSGNLAYEWRRSGVTTGSTALNYTITSSDYSTAGTYYFNRYAKDNACATAVWVAATGTYTLGVIQAGPPVPFPTTLCTQCCYDGSAWVDCYVTTYAFPFDNSTYTGVVWSGNGTTYYSGASGSGSDKNGKVNTSKISSQGVSAVQICKGLGDGWYLPAYEELINMSAGSDYPPLNDKPSGANITSLPSWSSSEIYPTSGRAKTNTIEHKENAVNIDPSGQIYQMKKTGFRWVHCAWRN